MQIWLSYSRTAKQEQEELSHNQIQVLFLGPVGCARRVYFRDCMVGIFSELEVEVL